MILKISGHTLSPCKKYLRSFDYFLKYLRQTVLPPGKLSEDSLCQSPFEEAVVATVSLILSLVSKPFHRLSECFYACREGSRNEQFGGGTHIPVVAPMDQTHSGSSLNHATGESEDLQGLMRSAKEGKQRPMQDRFCKALGPFCEFLLQIMMTSRRACFGLVD